MCSFVIHFSGGFWSLGCGSPEACASSRDHLSHVSCLLGVWMPHLSGQLWTLSEGSHFKEVETAWNHSSSGGSWVPFGWLKLPISFWPNFSANDIVILGQGPPHHRLWLLNTLSSSPLFDSCWEALADRTSKLPETAPGGTGLSEWGGGDIPLQTHQQGATGVDMARCLFARVLINLRNIHPGFWLYCIFDPSRERTLAEPGVRGWGGSLCNAQASGPHTDPKWRSEEDALTSEEAGQLQAENLGLDIPQPPVSLVHPLWCPASAFPSLSQVCP